MSLVEAHQAVVNHMLELGVFDHVGQSEPPNPPGKGLYAAMWFDDIRPALGMSSLVTAGMVYTYIVRMYKNATSTPADSIDLDLVAALEAVYDSLIGDHTLEGSAYAVDVLGAYSGGMNAVTDYVDFGRKQMYRVVDLTLPVVLDGVHRYAG